MKFPKGKEYALNQLGKVKLLHIHIYTLLGKITLKVFIICVLLSLLLLILHFFFAAPHREAVFSIFFIFDILRIVPLILPVARDASQDSNPGRFEMLKGFTFIVHKNISIKFLLKMEDILLVYEVYISSGTRIILK